ncbi:MAG: hypothetical protein HDR25_05600 [Lachnospiraceae bacterium]|nr:hypothetical protein [Lachnospiraceae bacterium]
MADKTMETLLWNSLYGLIERSYQQNLCCQRYVDRKRKQKRVIDWIMVLVPGIGSLLYFWEPIATVFASASTAVLGLINNITPVLTQPESELSEIDEYAKQFSQIRIEAENLVMRYTQEKDFGDNEVRKVYVKLQKQLEDVEIVTNKLFHHISTKENNYLEIETKKYLSKYNHG